MKACIACKHFSMTFGSPTYSTLTSGNSASADCALNKHRFDLMYSDESYVRKDMVQIATACDSYELSDDAKAMGWQ